MTIEIDAKGYSLERGRSQSGDRVEVARGDDAAVLAYAQETRKKDGETRLAAISVAPDMPLRELLGIIEAVRGPECTTAADEDCVLPDVVVLARSAHRYNPRPMMGMGGYVTSKPDSQPKGFGGGLLDKGKK